MRNTMASRRYSAKRRLRSHAAGRAGARVPRAAAISPLRQLRELGKTPVIDVGTLARIKRGEIAVHPGIETFTAQGIRFSTTATRCGNCRRETA